MRDKTRLSKMQDIAGLRVVEDLNMLEQDELAKRIVALFEPRPRTIDRRNDPRFGYRAVHVVVFVDECPVEVQVRTRLKDAWANAMEIVGDRIGRFVRYEEPPVGLEEVEPVAPDPASNGGATVLSVVLLLYKWSDLIKSREEGDRQAAFVQRWLDETEVPAQSDPTYETYRAAEEFLASHRESAPEIRAQILSALDELVAALKGYQTQ